MLNDVFRQDLFSLTALTAAINELPYIPSQIQKLGLFEEDSIATIDCSIEFEKGQIQIVDVRPRGAPGSVPDRDKRRIYSFRVPHLPQSDGLLADQVQGVRAFGTEGTPRTIEAERDKVLVKMRRQIDVTMELHRMTALMGSFYDANGIVTSLLNQFGVVQQTVNFALTTANTKLRQKCVETIEKVEGALDGVGYTDMVALCGSSYWKELIEHPGVKETYLGAQQAAELRGSPLQSFEFGDISWTRYRGSSLVKVPDDEAIIVPRGVPEMLITRFAPANYVETVNSAGLPYYAKAEPMKMGKGYDIEAQSNPLNICTRPHAIIRATKA